MLNPETATLFTTRSLLNLAVKASNVIMVEMLLERFDVDMKDEYGNNPLLKVCHKLNKKQADYEIAALIFKKGPDTAVRIIDGSTPRESLAWTSCSGRYSWSP